MAEEPFYINITELPFAYERSWLHLTWSTKILPSPFCGQTEQVCGGTEDDGVRRHQQSVAL